MSDRFPIVFIAMLLTAPAVAQDWAHWRGPNYNGSTEATGLPQQFDTTTHVVWSVDMPGPGFSTPVICGDQLYITSFDERSRQIWAMAFNRHTGQVLWKKPLGYGQRARMRGRENFLAGPSPTSDGQRVIFLAGNGELACFTPAGKELWRHNLVKKFGKLTILWDFASSPTLIDGTVYVNVLRRDRNPRNRNDPKTYSGYLAAFDPATGEQKFYHARPNKANRESQEAYTTPLPLRRNNSTSILVLGGDCLTAHDPKTGAEGWRVTGWNPRDQSMFRIVPSVLVAGEVAVVSAPQGEPVYAYRFDADDPHKTAPQRAWVNKDTTADAPTPLYYRDRLYILNDKKQRLDCLNPQTGEILWSGDLPEQGVFRASPAAADGRIYLVNSEGTVFSVATGDRFKILHKADLGGYPTYASPAIAHGRLYVRTAEKLWCFGADSK